MPLYTEVYQRKLRDTYVKMFKMFCSRGQSVVPGAGYIWRNSGTLLLGDDNSLHRVQDQGTWKAKGATCMINPKSERFDCMSNFLINLIHFLRQDKLTHDEFSRWRGFFIL